MTFMSISSPAVRPWALFLVALAGGLSTAHAGDQAVTAKLPNDRDASRVTAVGAVAPEVPRTLSPGATTHAHPLAAVLEFARQEREYLRQTVRVFTCRLVKRERIDGFLQDYHFIDMRVREAV